jgi:hypothetical protein
MSRKQNIHNLNAYINNNNSNNNNNLNRCLWISFGLKLSEVFFQFFALRPKHP